MPLSVKLLSETPVTIGNQLVIGQENIPYRSGVNLSAWNYNLLPQDYFAGSIQFLYVISFIITVDPLADLGLTQSNPNQQRYGNVAIRNLDNYITETHVLQYPRQQIQLLSPIHVLPRQESARPKQYLLGSRPRFLASSSVAQQFNLSGRFPATGGVYTGTGITAPTPGTFTESGSINFLAVTPPTLDIARRSLILDVTDGSLGLTDGGNDPLYYTNTNYDNNIDIYRPGTALIYLMPGAVGTVKLDVYKLTEPGALGSNKTPVYVPTATFPTI